MQLYLRGLFYKSTLCKNKYIFLNLAKSVDGLGYGLPASAHGSAKS